MTSLIMTADTIGLHKVSDWLKGIANAMARSATANKTIKELSSLTDKELNDIGISRGEIYSLAWGERND